MREINMCGTETDLVLNWSEEELASRLGISSAVFQQVRLGGRQIAMIREGRIAHLELSTIPGSFDYRDRKQVSEIAQECARQGVSVVSFHTSLFPFESPDEATRKRAVQEALVLAQIAAEMGAGILSCHFGANNPAKTSIAEMLAGLDGLPLLLAVENVGQVGIQGALRLVDEFNTDRFRMLLDIGHERDSDGINPFVKRDQARRAAAQCRGRLCAVHLHETFPIDLKPDHRPPLYQEGIIAWGQVLAGLKDVDYRGILMFEDGRGENPEEWVDAVGRFPGTFVQRYGGAS